MQVARQRGAAQPGGSPSGARGQWALRDHPGLLWMVLAVAVAAAHPLLTGSRWLVVHLVLLGALTHSIMVWSTHFAQALLKTRPGLDDRRTQSQRLILLFVGTSITLVGVPTRLGWVTLAGALLVTAAVLWHAVQLARRLRAALPGRFRITIRYYLAAALCLPIGAGLGVGLALGLGGTMHGRVLLAHTMVNVLGWVGLTVAGTLLTLWPTMLRTQITPQAEGRATQALPGLAGALALLVVGALADLRWLSLLALGAYALSLLWWASAVLAPVRRSWPREFAAASVGLALVWWLVGLGDVLVQVATAQTWGELAGGFGRPSAILVVGFAAQLLPGALSYLLPSVLGGGRTVVLAGQKWFDRWAMARLVIINVGLVIGLLPVPSLVRTLVSALVLMALAAFIPLMLAGIAAAVAARRTVADRALPTRPLPAPTGPESRPSIWSTRQAVAAVGALALAISIGIAVGEA